MCMRSLGVLRINSPDSPSLLVVIHESTDITTVMESSRRDIECSRLFKGNLDFPFTPSSGEKREMATSKKNPLPVWSGCCTDM